MAGYTLEVHCTDDGQFVCTNEPDADEAQEQAAGAEGTPKDLQQDASAGQTFTDPKQVAQWVLSQLQGSQDPKAAWADEASSRDGSGYRKPGSPMQPM